MHIVITGASSGIGAALARELGAAGHALSLVARRGELLAGLAAEIRGPVSTFSCDLGDLEQCTAWVDEAVARHGPIDALINNAGVQYVEPAIGVSVERAEALFRVDLLAPMRLADRVVRDMVARRAGHIVNVASMAAITHTPGMAHYNAAKAGLAAWSETLRVELRGTGVHVLTVYPGPVSTPMESAARDNYGHAGLTDRVPTGTPETLAKLVHEAMRRRRPRVVYPRVYGIARYLRVTAQWVADRFTPPPKGREVN